MAAANRTRAFYRNGDTVIVRGMLFKWTVLEYVGRNMYRVAMVDGGTAIQLVHVSELYEAIEPTPPAQFIVTVAASGQQLPVVGAREDAGGIGYITVLYGDGVAREFPAKRYDGDIVGIFKHFVRQEPTPQHIEVLQMIDQYIPLPEAKSASPKADSQDDPAI